MSRSFRLLLVGVCLLGLLLALPDAGRAEGRSFFTVAWNCTWGRLGEWGPAWCSMKIIFLGAGTLCVLISGWLMATALAGKEVLEWVVFVLALAPIFCLWLGIYCLIKAVL